MIDFTALPDVGWGHSTHVKRVGDYIFLSNIIGALPDGRIVQHWDDLPPEGRDLKTGKRHLDFREGKLGAQTWLVLQRLQAILQQHGSSIENIAKMQIYLTNKTHFPFMERVRMRLFDVQPPSSCLGVQQVDPSGDAVIAIDVVAAVAGSASEVAQRIDLASGKQAIGIFAPGIRTREHVYFAGQIPIDLDTGGVVVNRGDLPAGLQAATSGNFDVDYWEDGIAAQTIDVYRQIDGLLKQEGLSFNDVTREVVYLRSLRDAPNVERVRRSLMPNANHPVTTFQVSDVGSFDALNIEIDIVAARPGADPHKVALKDARHREGFAVRSGNLLFVRGHVGVDAGGTQIARTPSQVASKAVRKWGRVAPRLERAAVQTAAILESMKAGLAANGLGLSNLHKLNIFLTDYRDYVAVSDTLAEFFPDNPPTVSPIQVPVAGPGKETTVAIDAIGAVSS